MYIQYHCLHLTPTYNSYSERKFVTHSYVSFIDTDTDKNQINLKEQ